MPRKKNEKPKKSNKKELTPFMKEKIKLIQELYDLGLDPKKTTIRTRGQSISFDKSDFVNYHNYSGRGSKIVAL